MAHLHTDVQHDKKRCRVQRPLSDDDRGLLSVIVSKRMLTSVDEGCKIWIDGSIDAFLQNGTQAEQNFFAQHGLVQSLIRELCDDRRGRRFVDSYHRSFDLLGTLCKFNFEMFEMLEEEFEKDSGRMQRFFKAATTDLVDSNIFLRFAILSFKKFGDELKLTLQKYSPERYNRICHGRLAKYLDANKQQLLKDLISCLRVDEVNQKNMCCLNTLVAILMTASDNSDFTQLSEDLKRHQFVSGHEVTNADQALKQLLDIWRDYHKFRALDGLSLEQSHHIPFRIWRETVERLYNIL